jgi:hypothetical protein
MGKFHVGQDYDLEDMKLLEHVELFPCKEMLANNKSTKG